jgi:hypothetical protein
MEAHKIIDEGKRIYFCDLQGRIFAHLKHREFGVYGLYDEKNNHLWDFKTKDFGILYVKNNYINKCKELENGKA